MSNFYWEEEADDPFFEDSIGECGNFGHELYQEGTEMCGFCHLSEICFEAYVEWRKKQ